MVDELVEQVAFLDLTEPRCGRRPVAVQDGCGRVPHLGEAAVDPDRPGACETQLGAVVLRRVVGGGEDRPGHVEPSRGEVHQIGRGEADVDDVGPLLSHPARELLGEFHARSAHVARDDDAVGVGEPGEADPERMRDIGVHLLGNGATDVIRLDDFIQYRHRAALDAIPVRGGPRPGSPRRTRRRGRDQIGRAHV